MKFKKLNNIKCWKDLEKCAKDMLLSKNHLKHLINEPERINRFSLGTNDLFYDYSRQRVDKNVMNSLFELAEICDVKKKFTQMMSGEKINITEDRAALHTASRTFSKDPIFIDKKDIMPEIICERNKVKKFSEDVSKGKIKGSTNKKFKHNQ